MIVSPGNDALPGQAFEEDAAEGPDVRPFVDRLALRLLRAHVGGRAEDHARLRHLRRDRRRVGDDADRRFVEKRPGQPEVQDLDLALGRQLDVRRA